MRHLEAHAPRLNISAFMAEDYLFAQPQSFIFPFFLSSGGWVKMKVNHPHFHVSLPRIRYMCTAELVSLSRMNNRHGHGVR